MNPERISPIGRRLLDRRGFLGQSGMTMGALALAQLLSLDRLLAEESRKGPIRPEINQSNPYAARSPHFEMPARQVLVIYCPGAVSHVDTFDYKPDLYKLEGQKPPGIPSVTFEGPSGNIAKPFWDFKPRGQTGKMVSDLLPNLAEMVDEFCFIHSMNTQTSAHPQGENFMNTGFTMEGFPSFGAWVTYALGSENGRTAGLCCDQRSAGIGPKRQEQFWKRLSAGRFSRDRLYRDRTLRQIWLVPKTTARMPIEPNVSLLQRLNARHMQKYPGDADLAARIASYELAGRMQTSVPEVMEYRRRDRIDVHQAYGTDSGTDLKKAYANNCILARRLLEKGVRVVQLFNGSDPSGGNGITNWDSHARTS